jgi:hypothetical protein
MIFVILKLIVRAAALCLMVVALSVPARADLPAPIKEFLESYCLDCHDAATRKGGLDLENLRSDVREPAIFRTWV